MDDQAQARPHGDAPGLPALLEVLDQAAEDGLRRVTLHGRAVSRSDEALHLATPTGLVSIPLDQIEGVHPYPALRPDPTLVYVEVQSVDRVRMLRSADVVGTSIWPDAPDCGPSGPTVPVCPPPLERTDVSSTYSRDCIATGGDTGTRTGSENSFDATDDAPRDVCTGLHQDD